MTKDQSQPSATVEKLPGAFELFDPSWKAFTLNCWTFILGVGAAIGFLILLLVIAGIGIASFAASEPAGSSAPTVHATVFNIIAIIGGVLGIILVSLIYVPFLYHLKLQSAKGVKIGIRNTIKQSRKFFWRIMGLYIVRGLIIAAGFVLFIVPGLFMWRRYMLAPYYLMDKNLDIGQAMKRSAADSVKFSGAIWGMIAIYILIELLGFIPLFGYLLGPIVGIVYCCAQGIRYLQVQQVKS